MSPPVRSALSLASALVGPFGSLALAAGVALALAAGGGAGPDGEGAPTPAARAVARTDGTTLHLSPVVPAGENFTRLVVHGPDGEDLIKVSLDRVGCCTLESAGSNPVRFIVRRDRSRAVSLGLGTDHAGLAVQGGSDGTLDLTVVSQGPEDAPPYGLRVDARGNVLPSVVRPNSRPPSLWPGADGREGRPGPAVP